MTSCRSLGRCARLAAKRAATGPPSAAGNGSGPPPAPHRNRLADCGFHSDGEPAVQYPTHVFSQLQLRRLIEEPVTAQAAVAPWLPAMPDHLVAQRHVNALHRLLDHSDDPPIFGDNDGAPNVKNSAANPYAPLQRPRSHRQIISHQRLPRADNRHLRPRIPDDRRRTNPHGIQQQRIRPTTKRAGITRDWRKSDYPAITSYTYPCAKHQVTETSTKTARLVVARPGSTTWHVHGRWPARIAAAAGRSTSSQP